MPVSATPFSFNYNLEQIMSSSGNVAKKNAIVPGVPQPSSKPAVYRTAIKKDNLLDVHVQLGLLKPTAEQMKVKAPVHHSSVLFDKSFPARIKDGSLSVLDGTFRSALDHARHDQSVCHANEESTHVGKVCAG